MYRKISDKFIIFLVFLIILNVLPVKFQPEKPRIDLIFHFFYFFIFSIFTESKEEKIILIFIPLISELIQQIIPYRSFDFYDLLSDYLGIICGYLSFKYLLKNKENRFKFMGSAFGIGIVLPSWKGTFTSFLSLLFLIFLKPSKLTLTILIFFVYFLHFALKEHLKGKDPDYFTIDEIAGTLPAFYLNSEPFFYAIYFLLFRIFDIKKPLFIKKTEKISSFNGVFLDDFVSGISALLITYFIEVALKKILNLS